MSGWGLLIVLAAMAALVLLGMWWRLSARRMTPAERQRVERALAHARGQKDPLLRVLEADKALEAALRAAGFSGSTGDMLKAAGPRMANLDAVWSAHKLRNRLAHETHAAVTEREADQALGALERAIYRLIG